jgi:hypothetical protein
MSFPFGPVGIGLQAGAGLFGYFGAKEAAKQYNAQALELYRIATEQTYEQVKFNALRVAVQRQTERLSEVESLTRLQEDLAAGLSTAQVRAAASNLEGTTVREAQGDLRRQAGAFRAGVERTAEMRDAAAVASVSAIVLEAQQALLQARPQLQAEPSFLGSLLGIGGSAAMSAASLYGPSGS